MSSMHSPGRIIIPWPTEQGPFPFDCLVCICEYLQPEDLVRFALACREFYHVARSGRLWRLHCLHRWVVCSLIRVPEGGDRWRRYYIQRRRLEVAMGRGQPSRDYYSLSLRGHKTQITKLLYLKSIDINYDGLLPLNIASYDRSGLIIAWEVYHTGSEGDSCWEGRTSKRRSAMASSLNATTLAYPDPAADRVRFLSTQNWRENKRSHLKLPLMTSASGRPVLVTSLLYGELIGKLPKPFLIVGRGADTECSRIEIWDPHDESMDKPVVILDTVSLVPTIIQLSTNNILAVCGDREYEESCSPYVKVWDLTVLPVDGSTVKEHILIRSKRDVMNVHWWNGRIGVLAIGATGEGGLTLWELQPYLDELRPSKSEETRKKRLSLKPATKQPETVSLLYTNANYTVSNFHFAENYCPFSSTKFYLLFGGSQGNELNMLSIGENKHVALQVEHTGIITGVAATDFGVFTCSRDFSVRVFKWRKGKTLDEPPTLDSLYTLLGGSVVHTAYGYSAVDHSYNTVAGLTGERIIVFLFQR